MRHKFFTLAISLLVFAFAANAQKMIPAEQVPSDKQEVQKKIDHQSPTKDIEMKKNQENYQGSSVLENSLKSFSTLSAKAVIFEDGFETFPGVWTLDPGTGDDWLQGDGTTYGPGTVVEGSNAAYFDDYNYSSGTSSSMETEVDLSTATAPKLEFFYWDGGSTDVVEVAVSTNGTDYTTEFTTAEAVDPWAKQTVDLTGYAGEASVFIKFIGTCVYGMTNPHVDDVVVYEPELYQFALTVPTGETVLAGESYDYTVTVSNNGANDDIYNLSITGNGSWTYELFADDGTTSISTLDVTAGTSEDFVVKVSLAETVGTFETDTENIVVTSQGDNSVTDNFDITTKAIGTDAYVADFNDAVIPPSGWTSTDGVWTSSSSTVYEGAAAAYSYNPDTLITPKLEIEDGDQLKFFARNSSFSGGEMAIIISDDKENWTALTTAPATLSDTYEEFTVDFTSAEAGTKYIGFVDVSDYFYLDYVIFESSLSPYGFSLTVPTGAEVNAGESYDYTVTIANTGLNGDDFTPAIVGDGSWDYELVEAADSVTALTTPVTIAAGDSYDFVIKVTVPATGVALGDADTESFTVSSAETGKAVETFDITTSAIAPAVVPFAENFDAGYPPAAWTETQGLLADPVVTDGTTSAWAGDDFANDEGATTAARLNNYGTSRDEWMITPSIDLESKTCLLSFDLALTPWNGTDVGTFGADDKFAVVISTDDGATWTDANALLIYDGTHEFTLNEHVVLDLTGYSGVVKFGFYGESTESNEDNDLFVDNVSVTEMPANDGAITDVMAPANGLIGNPVQVSAEVTNYGSDALATGTTVSFKEDGTEFATATTTADLAWGETEVLTVDYTPSATGTLTIEASVPADDNTANDAMSTTIDVIQAGSLFETFESDVPPLGWNLGTNTGEYTWEAETDGWAPYILMDGQYAILVSNSNGDIDTLFTPELTLDGSITQLSFDIVGAFQTTANGGAVVELIYSADGETWTVAHTVDLTADDSYRTEVADLSGIADGDYYFAFATTNTYTNEDFINLIGIDNVMGPVMTNVQANDLGVVSVAYPQEFVMDGDEITIPAEIKNFGTVTQDGTEVTLNVDGSPVGTANIGSLAYSQSEVVEFTWTATAGHHVFEVSVPADDATGNDTKLIEGVVVGDGMLYEGFETDFPAEGWVLDTSGIWFQWEDPFVGAYEGITVAGTSVGEAATVENVIMATPKFALTETDEMFHFYGALGNGGVGEHQLDLVYSADGETWTDIAVNIPITGGMELYSYDLSAIPAGAYHIGFRAKVTGDGTYSTLYAIDHVVGPELAPVVTFNVDMNKPILMGEFDPAVDTVILAGDMNGWAEPGTDPSMFMEDPDEDGIYTLSMELADGDYEYKYFDGAGWDSGEWEGGDNRMFTVAGAPVTLNDVWANEYLVTFTVTADGEPAEGAIVSINGEELTTDVDGMAYIGLEDGDYPYTVSLTGFDDMTGTVTVAGGNENLNIEFITPMPFPFMDDFEGYAEGDYVADNSIAWTTWSENPGSAEDAVISTVQASSGVNSMLISGTNDMVLPFGDSTSGAYHVAFDIYVGADSSAYWNIQHVLLEEWAFEAYMNSDGTGELNADGATIPFVFESGAWHTVEHYIDLDNDEITLRVDGAVLHTWQFSLQSDGSAGTNQLSALNLYNGGATGTAAYYVDDVMFQSLYPVTFNVDMNAAITDGDFDAANDTLILAGSINGWMEPGADETMFMTDEDTDGIYTLTKHLPNGTYEYKYFNGAGWDGGEWEGGENRMFVVAGEPLTIDDTWGLEAYLVTFMVTENTVGVEGATVNINSTDLTTDADGYAYISLPDGDYPYTVSYADYPDVTGTINVAGAAVEETVNFVGIYDVAEVNFSVYPNPTRGIVNVMADGTNTVTVMNAIGKVVTTQQITDEGTIDLSNNSAGIYFIRLQNGDKVSTKRVIVQ